MVEPLLLLLPVGALGAVAWTAFRRPHGVYWKSAAGVLAVALGWAAIWLLASPANEAGFGFFAVWVVLVAIALALALVASAAATARHLVDFARRPRET